MSKVQDIGKIEAYLKNDLLEGGERDFLTSREIPVFEKLKKTYPCLSEKIDKVICEIRNQENDATWKEFTKNGSFPK